MPAILFFFCCLQFSLLNQDDGSSTVAIHEPSLFIAHRGLTSAHLENTLEAFMAAFDHGVDGVEFDVQLSRDLVPMVFHDRSLERLTGKDLFIEQMDHHELSELRQGDDRYRNTYPIYTLTQVLEHMPEGKLINIELKETTKAHGLEGMRKILEVIDPYKNTLDPIISSFDPAILELVHNLDDEYLLALLLDKENIIEAYLDAQAVLEYVDLINPHIDMLNAETSQLIKVLGVPLLLWGHERLGQEVHFIQDDHVGIISDVSEQLGELYSPFAQLPLSP